MVPAFPWTSAGKRRPRARQPLWRGLHRRQRRAPAAPPVAEPTAEARNLAAEARAHYDRAMAAQRAGDWAKYGEEIRLLGQVLEHMKNR